LFDLGAAPLALPYVLEGWRAVKDQSTLVRNTPSTRLCTHLDDHSVSYHVKRWPGDFLTDVKHPLQLTSVGVR
jgi:hypothetical protein